MITIGLHLSDILAIRDISKKAIDDYATAQNTSIYCECIPLSCTDSLATHLLHELVNAYSCGIVVPATATSLPEDIDAQTRTNGITLVPPADLFLPCVTPVGPGKCLHPGSHHAANGGHCTHHGCDCGVFCPDMTTPKVSVSIETVMDYVRRVTLLKNIIWDGDDAFAALHRAWIPGAAPSIDWHPMLGRVFPELAEAFSEVTPL